MEEFKNLKEIIELCQEELYAGDRNIHATLGFEELKELHCLLNDYGVHKRGNEILLAQKRELEKERDGIYADYQELGKEKLQLEEKVDEYTKQLDLDYVDKNFVSKDKIKKRIKELNSYIEKWKVEKDKPKEQCGKAIMRLTAQIGTLEELLEEEVNNDK